MKSKHRDGQYLLKQAEKAGLEVSWGKGDHGRVRAPEGRGYMIIPARELGTGLASKAVKWLVSVGVVLGSIFVFLWRF